MKVAVYFDGYLPMHETKDPGLIPLGLNRINCPTVLVTTQKASLTTYRAPFPLLQTEPGSVVNVHFWDDLNVDVVICYTWLQRRYNALLETIRRSGSKVAIKADSAGRLGYPAFPRSVRVPFRGPFGALAFRYLCAAADLTYRLPSAGRIALRLSPLEEHLRSANAVIIESPLALENVRGFFRIRERQDIASKFHFIPNPVAEDITMSGTNRKRNYLISIGRWSDPAKNRSVMLDCIRRFLPKHVEWDALIVGETPNVLHKEVAGWSDMERTKLRIIGEMAHEKLVGLLAKTKILLIPSLSESWGFSAAEAVCMGCSVVGTPLESLTYLVAGGFSGTLSDNFRVNSVSEAVEHDAYKHASSIYKYQDIAQYWRTRLSLMQVAKKIRFLLTNICE